MAKMTIAQLGKRLSDQRGIRGLRDTAKEVGISPATLSRVEHGNIPDLETFAKICRWLQIDPAEVLGVEIDRTKKNISQDGVIAATAHFKAEQTPSPDLARALAELILSTHNFLGSESK